jgi:hypothetical protein
MTSKLFISLYPPCFYVIPQLQFSHDVGNFLLVKFYLFFELISPLLIYLLSVTIIGSYIIGLFDDLSVAEQIMSLSLFAGFID